MQTPIAEKIVISGFFPFAVGHRALNTEYCCQKTKIMASEIDGETVETVSDLIFWAPKSLQMVTAAMKLKDTYSLEEKL